MQQTVDEVMVGVEFPRKGEVVVSPQYTLKIAAPLDACSVEMSIDGGPYGSCRQDGQCWWFDWANYDAGYHTAAIRITLRDGCVLVVPTHEMEVKFAGESQSLGQPSLTQISVLADNRPGMLAKITKLLSGEGVDLNGAVTERIGDKTAFRFLTARVDGLRDMLEEAGFAVMQNQVFQVELPSRATELNRLAHVLAEEGVNILSLYCTAHGAKARYVISVDRPETAVNAIAKNGLQIVAQGR